MISITDSSELSAISDTAREMALVPASAAKQILDPGRIVVGVTGGTVLHVLTLSRSAVTIRHWFEIDLSDASMEHGSRIEVRELRKQQHRGTESASQLVVVDRTIWRADLFDRLSDNAGSFGAAHFHPEFADNEPCARAWDAALTADPWGWLGDQVATLGGDTWNLDPADAAELRGLAATVVGLARQFSPELCGSAAECFRLTRDVGEAVQLMVDGLRAPDLLDASWVAPWLAPDEEGRLSAT
jgi:hypothetical protein